MQPRLIAVAGLLKGSVFPLTQGEWTVGRGAACQLSLRDTGVSREHCVFRFDGQRCLLRDLSSHNGTFVNSLLIGEKEILQGDQIRIGSSVFLFLTSAENSVSASPDQKTIELRPQDSVYLTSEHSRELEPSVRATHDLQLLLRLSTMLHSMRALHNAQNLTAETGLARHLLSLLMDILPAESSAVLLCKGDPGSPVSVLSQSSRPVAVQDEIVRKVMDQRVAILMGHETGEPAATLAAPVVVREEVVAILYLESCERHNPFDEGHLQLLTAVTGMAAIAWENASLLEWLREENEQLREELKIEHGMLGDSVKIRELQKQIGRVAASSSTVLILGESGTGKELIARAIHRNSPRATGPFAPINCAALTDTLLESELFGYEKGAFTGALSQRKGKLEAAAGGTVFLDEIGELSPVLQAKLLRVLQERELQRVGGTQTIKLDIRLLAATNRDLEDAVKKGTFRQDLFYRLNVVSLKATPLRQRPEDIPALAEHFAKKFALQCGRKLSGITPEARAYLRSYSWPGNVRELENAIERAVVLGSSDAILPEDLPENIREERPAEVSATLYEEAVEAAKRQVVMKAFDQAGYDHEQAAKILGLHPNYLHRLIRNMDLRGTLKAVGKGR
ncbi:MAG: sigma 54-interacting transcriptional regulator [Bryobacteraceae bacterium]